MPWYSHLRSAVIAAAALLAPIAASAQQEKTVTLYTMQLKPMFTEYMTGIITKFEAANPGTKVQWLDYPAQEYETKLLSLISGGRAPDIINLNNEMTVRLCDKGFVLPLDDRLTSAQRDMFIPAVMESGCTVRGKLQAIPWYQATKVLMYNKAILKEAGLDPEKPPTNRTELYAISRTIKEKTGKFGFLPNLSEYGELKNIFARDGIALVDDTGKKAVFQTPEAEKILTEIKDLYDTGVIPRESLTAEHRRSIDLFKQGKIAFFESGPQFLKFIKEETPEVYKTTAVAPAAPIGKTGRYEVDTQNLVIYNKSPQAEAAVKLALFITSAENQLEFCRKVAIFPSVTDALKDPFFAAGGDTPEDQARVVGAKQMQKAGILVPPLPRLGELNRAMEDAVRSVIRGGAPAKALADAAKRWDDILARP